MVGYLPRPAAAAAAAGVVVAAAAAAAGVAGAGAGAVGEIISAPPPAGAEIGDYGIRDGSAVRAEPVDAIHHHYMSSYDTQYIYIYIYIYRHYHYIC